MNRGHAAQSTEKKKGGARADNCPIGLTHEENLSANDTSLPPRARSLIRIGEHGIAKENAAVLAVFFHPQFIFHGPAGSALNREQLWSYFAAWRAAFHEFAVTRQVLVSAGAGYVAAPHKVRWRPPAR